MANARVTKRKRNDDMMNNIPEGFCTEFVSVRDLTANQAPKPKKIKMDKDLRACGENNKMNEDIELEHIITLPRRTQSAGPSASRGPAEKLMEKKGKLPYSSALGSKPSKPGKKTLFHLKVAFGHYQERPYRRRSPY